MTSEELFKKICNPVHHAEVGVDIVMSKVKFIESLKLAYNQAIDDSYKNSEVRIEYDSVRKGEPNGFSDDKIWIRDNDGSGCNFYIEKQSILKLKIK